MSCRADEPSGVQPPKADASAASLYMELPAMRRNHAMYPNASAQRITCLSLAVAVLVAACGRDSTRPDTVPAEIQVSAVDTLRSIGATATLTATARNASQQSLPGIMVSSWESSNPSVVTVDAATGLATAVANGEATVTARAGTVTGSTVVVVRQRFSATRSTISVTRSLTFVGDTVRATLRLRDSLDNPIRLAGATVVLSSNGGTSTLTAGQTVDQGDGSYTSDFVGGGVGAARTIGATIDGSALTIATAPTLRVVGFTKIVAQGTADGLTCGIITTGELYCWGSPDGIVRGTGTAAPTGSAPTLVAGGHRWTDVDLKSDGGCGITDSAKLYCWGYAIGLPLNGVIGYDSPSPIAVLPESSFVSVDIGTCALTTGHTAMCWSSNQWGQSGNGTRLPALMPTPVSGGYRFAAISISVAGSCGVTEAGAAMCWGHSDVLGVGAGPYPDVCGILVACALTPIAVSGGITFRPIIVHGDKEVCAIATNDRTYCWGLWDQVPTEVPGAPVFTAIAIGYTDNCGVAQSGLAYCWGTNRNGRFGMPADYTDVHRVPELVPGGQRFTQLSMGSNHMCGVATDGNAWCWGSNAVGELGDGTTTPSAVPVRVRLFGP